MAAETSRALGRLSRVAVATTLLVVVAAIGLLTARAASPLVRSSVLVAREPLSVPMPSAAAPSAMPVRVEPVPGNPCNPPDPIGLGPWTPYLPLNLGRVTMPQRGGVTPDGGYDVIVHFHGHEPARKALVKQDYGFVYIGVDLGVGSGPYEKRVIEPGAWKEMLHELGGRLRKHRGAKDAHVRHLGLSAWSAGYGAIVELLKARTPGIDAVILLDGLHAAWRDGKRESPGPGDVDLKNLTPVVDFARCARDGDGTFVFTHSFIDPIQYPGTGPTAARLLATLGVESIVEDPGSDPFGRVGRAERGGFHVFAYAGKGTEAHCAHLFRYERVLREVLGPAWATPKLDRNVKFSPKPL
jgi:hypothetical protein